MVQFTFDGKSYNFTTGGAALSFARSTWEGEFGKHSLFTKAYEEAAFKERYPEGYTVSDPRTGKKRFVSPEEAYPPKKEEVGLELITTQPPKDKTEVGLELITTQPPKDETKPGLELITTEKPKVKPTTEPITTTVALTQVAAAQVPAAQMKWTPLDKLESGIRRFTYQLGELQKRETALNDVLAAVGEIDALHESLQVRDKLGEYVTWLESTLKVNNSLVTLYNNQIKDVNADFAKNTTTHEDIVANSKKYDPASYAAHLKDWANYEANVKKALSGYAEAISSHEGNTQAMQTQLTQSKAGETSVTAWSKEAIAVMKSWKTPIAEWSVSYVKDGKQETEKFATEHEAKNFVFNQQQKQMDDASFVGQWPDFVKHVNSQKAYVSWLTTKGVIGLEDGEAKLLKPIEVLTNEEIDVANKAGFKIPKLYLGASMSIYQWARDTLPQGSLPREATEATAAMIGQFTDILWSPYRFIAGLIPGEQPLEKGIRVVTPATMKYVEDLTPAQQTALDVGGIAATVGASYITAIPVGMTAKGISILAGKLATALPRVAKVSLKTPALASQIAKFLRAHPKATQVMLYATIGVVGPDIERTEEGQIQIGIRAAKIWERMQERIQRGEDVNAVLSDIVRDEAYRIAGAFGGLKGFKAGFNLIPVNEWARLQKLIKLEEFDDPVTGRKRVLPTIDSRKIPKELADLLQIELDPITGKEIVVGPATEAGVTRNVAREYGKLLDDLVAGKAVTADPINAVKGAILDYATPEQFGELVQKGLNLEIMSPREIADLMMKELNWRSGSPWQQILRNAEMEFLKKGGRTTIDIFTAFSEQVPSDGILGLTSGRDLYDSLISKGLHPTDALATATNMLSGSPSTLVTLANQVGLSQQATERLLSQLIKSTPVDDIISGMSAKSKSVYSQLIAEGNSQAQALTYMAELTSFKPVVLAKVATDIGISQATLQSMIQASLTASTLPLLSQSLSTQGLSLKEIRTALPLLIAPVSISVMVEQLPKLSTDAFTVVAPVLNQTTLQQALPQLATPTLMNIVPALDRSIIDNILPKLKPDVLISVIPALRPDVLAGVLPSLKPMELSESVSKLTKDQLKIFVDLIPDLTVDQIAYTVPVLDLDTLTLTLQTMRFDVPTLITTIEGITPGLIPGLPRFLRRMRDLKREKKSRSLEPYKVTFRQLHVRDETHHVKARSFREALIVAWKLKKQREDPREVEVEKVKAGSK